MERSSNYIFHLGDEEETLPMPSEEFCFFSEDENAPIAEWHNYLANDEESVFEQLSSDIDKAMSYANNLIAYTSIWRGRVLSVMQETVLACITKQQDMEEELFVEIQKSKLSKPQLEEMVPGTFFNWSFGYKNMDTEQRIWKIDIQQRMKPTPEAIRQMAARMIAGFESFYEEKD